LAADGAADRLQGTSACRGQVELEPVAMFAQRIDGVIHLQRRLRRQPGSKGKHALRRGVARHHHGDVAGDLRAIIARGPGDQDLRLGEQQRAEAVRLELQLPDPGLQPRLVLRRADAYPHQQDRGHHREAEQGERGRQHRDLLPVEVQQCRKCIDEVAGLRWRCRQQRCKSATEQAVARQ